MDLSKLAGEVAAGFAGYRRQDGGVTWVACLGDRPDEIVMARVAHGAVEYRTIRVRLEGEMTETTQPDPQVVAWEYAMVLTWPDGYEIDGRRRGEITPDPHRAFLGSTDGREARTLYRRRPAGEWEPAPRESVTLADIPAGQGAASLFLRDESDAVWFKRADGRVVRSENYLHIGEPGGLGHALREHLAATLRHVTDEED